MNNPPLPPYPRSSPRPSASSADKKSSSPARRQQITANPPKSQFRQPLRGQKSRSPRPSASSADKKAVLLTLLLLTLLLSACGRQPAEPTPLPPGTPVVQPTPDFSAPAQIGSANQTADQAAQALRTRLAQQRVQPTPTPAVSPAVPLAVPAVPLDASLDVFNRPNALGILSAGGILYAAPNGAVRANLQVGATLTITGRSADRAWYAAYLADGIAGWVPAAQVRVFGDTDELEIVQESLGPAVVATLIAQASQPQDPISAVVVRLTATTTPAGTAPEPAPQPTADAAAITGPAITGPAVTVIVEGANLRAGPGTDFPVVDVLYQNQTAALTGRNPAGDWLQLQRPTGPAWIFAPLVQTTVPTADLPIIQAP